MNEPVIQCQGLNKIYQQANQDLHILNDLDFSIEAGESVAIIGASGSGKTTLLNLLGGIDHPDSGKVIIAGQDISQLGDKAQDLLRNQTLGFVYQFHHLLGKFTAQENVAMPLIIAKHDFNDAMKRAEVILSQVGLSERLTHKPSQLSGGERQRVAFARALVNNPACVLMDEPTGNLDRNTAASVHQLMFEVKKQLTTSFIIVTHDQELAEEMDRVLVLEGGKLVPQSA